MTTTTKRFHRAALGLASMAIAAAIATACSDDPATTPTGTPNDAAVGGDEDGAATTEDSSPNNKDSGTKDGAGTDAKDSGPVVGDAITISDGQGRFTTRSFTDYTCPNLPGLGRVLRWVIPEDIRSAVGMPPGATYHFQIESASNNNVLIVGPPTDKKYFTGDQAINVALTGTLPQTAMTASSPATGTVTVSGKWTCP